jgi:DcuC family C4-dicarboxylate transporter
MSLIIALIAVIFAGRLILQRYNPQAVLLLTGLALMIIAQLFHYADITTLAKKTTGFVAFDLFEFIRDTLSSRAGGLGLQIMLIGGFAVYMSHIGASQVLVRISSKPLQKLNSPYLLLGISYLLGQFLSLFISSAAGLGLLLMATLYPLLTKLGCSRAAVAAVIASTCAVEFGPGSSNTVLASKLANQEVVDYFVHSQLPVVLPVVILIAVMHILVQRYFDRRSEKELETVELDQSKLKETETNAPLIYLLLPMLPLILMLVCSKLVLAQLRITLDTAVLISLFFCMICEYIRYRRAKEVMQGLQGVFNDMGKVFATVVTLIVAGETFSAGLKSVGAVDQLLHMTNTFGLGAAPIILMMALLTFLISALMGSGNAAFYSFAPMVPDISKHIGADVGQMLLPVQLSAGIGRTISPIAGVIIAVSGVAGLSPVDIVKRTFLPMIAAWFTMLAMTFFYTGQLLTIAPYLVGLALIIAVITFVIRMRSRRLTAQ